MSAPFQRWECVLCGFMYEEALGLPQDGIPPGTRWEEMPEDWTCPDCAAVKSDFSPAS
jgi:rubredoxin